MDEAIEVSIVFPYMILMPTFCGIVASIVFTFSSRKKVRSTFSLLAAGVVLAVFFSLLAGDVPGPWQAPNGYLLESPSPGSEKIVEDFLSSERKRIFYQVIFTVACLVPSLFMVRRLVGPSNENTNKSGR